MRSTLAIALTLVAAALGEVVEMYDCENVSSDHCQVNEVRITPCTKANGCLLKRGKQYEISFDFVPNFSTAKLRTAVYKADVVDVPFVELSDANGCDYTTCPTEAGKSQQLNYGLRLSKKLPRGTFIIKWKLWNQVEPDQLCCFKTAIEIR
ncbi:unnamed protein product, partial [Iphiclides podalirius]